MLFLCKQTEPKGVPMCGIAGEVMFRPTADSETGVRQRLVERMIAAIRERGPDDVGFYTDATAALGVCRLAIVDIAGGRQPMSTPDGRYTIVYNGECYALDSLRAALVSRGAVFRTRADTEVVLQAYAQWGAAALDRLNGMFAVAIWDAWRRELFLARDRFGIKPLVYAMDGRRLLFGSTATALARRGDLELDVDPEAVEMFLASKFIAAPHTIYRQIKKLPAGHWARLSEGRLQVVRWWDLPLERASRQTSSMAAATTRVNGLLGEAVEKRRSSERPMGLCLSGGIDSSLLASHLRATDTKAFSIGQPGSAADETHIAAQVAANTRLAIRAVYYPQDLDDLFTRMITALDEPLGDSSCAALYCLSRRMGADVTVTLSGTGGDELFGGYWRYLAGLLSNAGNHLPRGGLLAGLKLVGLKVSGLKLAGLQPGREPAGWRRSLSRFVETVTDDPLETYLRLLSPTTPAIAAALRRPELCRADGGNRFADIARDHFERAAGESLLARLSYVDMKTVLVDDYLVKEDRMTMAHSLEGRFPFLDVDLAEYAFRLPDRLKIRGLTTKRVLRRLVQRQGLPAGIARARKRGLEVPLAGWLRGPLAERVRDTLLPVGAVIKEYCRPELVNQIVEDHLNGVADHGRLLWCLLTLDTWLDEQRQGEVPRISSDEFQVTSFK